jgi:hypothetical protein
MSEAERYADDMAEVVSLTGVRPAPRYDGIAWVTATVEEGPGPDGPWSDIGSVPLAPMPDPANPPRLDFTVSTALSSQDAFRVRFEDPSFNVSYTDPIGISTYPSTEELVEISTVQALTSLTPDQQDSLRAASIAAIETYCNQSFELEMNRTIALDGNGSDVLYLPRRLERLTAMTVNLSGLEVGDVTVSPEHDRLIVRTTALTPTYYTQAIRALDGHLPLRFVHGTENVILTGDWGWARFPEPVKVALRKDMEETALADSMALSETIRSYRKLGINDISQGDLRASIGATPTLSDQVIALLRPFVWEGRVGAVA